MVQKKCKTANSWNVCKRWLIVVTLFLEELLVWHRSSSVFHHLPWTVSALFVLFFDWMNRILPLLALSSSHKCPKRKQQWDKLRTNWVVTMCVFTSRDLGRMKNFLRHWKRAHHTVSATEELGKRRKKRDGVKLEVSLVSGERLEGERDRQHSSDSDRGSCLLLLVWKRRQGQIRNLMLSHSSVVPFVVSV